MRKSSFQFSNPMLSEFQFYVNEGFNSENAEIELKLEVHVNKKHITKTEAIVELALEVGRKDSENPFYIRAVEGAVFRWEEGAFDGATEVEKFLDVNAPALLVSYLRPVLANITMASKYPAYNVPFIDFNHKKED